MTVLWGPCMLSDLTWQRVSCVLALYVCRITALAAAEGCLTHTCPWAAL